MTPLRLVATVSLGLLAAACVDDPALDATEADLLTAAPATAAQARSAAVVRYNHEWTAPYTDNPPFLANAVRIGPRQVLVTGGSAYGSNETYFYADPSGVDPASRRRIIETRVLSDSWYDGWQPRVLVLDADVTIGAPAVLAWTVPPAGAEVQVVSAGPDVTGPDPTYALSTATGVAVATPTGPSLHTAGLGLEALYDYAAPVYHRGRVAGVSYRTEQVHADDCTDPAICVVSVPYYLDAILDLMDWTWNGSSGVGYTEGTPLEQFPAASERVCQYACANSGRCEAYNYHVAARSCALLQGRTGSVTSLRYRTGARPHYDLRG